MSSRSFFVAASTSFLVYATVTSDSAQKNPAASSVSASSMMELSRSSSTFRILRSIGSWHGCFVRSIAFNSRTVAMIGMSRVMTPPCNVFNFTSQDMAAKRKMDLATVFRRRFAFFLVCTLWSGLPDYERNHYLARCNIPKYSNSNWLTIPKRKSESESKKNHPKFSFLFQFMFHFFGFSWLLANFFCMEKNKKNNQTSAVEKKNRWTLDPR